MKEIWKDLPDVYTRRYQASSNGRIRSLDFYFFHSTWKINICRIGKIINTTPSKRHKYGRFMPTLKNGKRKEILLHHAIALVFLGPKPDGMWVLHKDGNSRDSRPQNLYYGTPSQNTHDAYKHGTLKCGTAHHKAKLTEIQVLEIFHSQEAGRSLARRFKVDPNIPRLIRSGKIWRSITSKLSGVDLSHRKV